MVDRDLLLKIFGQDVSASAALRKVGRTGTTQAKGVEAAWHKTKIGLAAAATGGLAVVTDALHTGFGEVKSYDTGLSQLQAGLRSTHRASHTTAGGLEGLASSIQDYSGQTDDSIVASEQLLLTFPKIRNEAGKTNDIFNQTVKISADMAQRLGGDASSSAIQLGKALNDPVKGITALTRVGVSFDDQQKKQIATDVAHHKTLAAQKIILGELNKEFGGSARMYGKTLPGEIDRTKRAWEDISQQLVEEVTPALLDAAKFARNDVIPELRHMAHWAKENEEPLKRVAVAVGAIALAMKGMKTYRSLQSLLGGASSKGFGGGGLLGGVISRSSPIPVFVTNEGFGGGRGVPTPVGGAGSRFGRIARALPIVGTIATGAYYAHGLTAASNAKSQQQLIERASSSAAALATVQRQYLQFERVLQHSHKSGGLFDNLANQYKTAIRAAGGVIPVLDRETAAQHRSNVEVSAGVGAIKLAITQSAQYVKSWNAVQRAIRKQQGPARSEADQLGRDIVAGLIAGMQDKTPEAEVQAKISASRVIHSLQSGEGFHTKSPSKKTFKIGQEVARGLLHGWNAEQRKMLQKLPDDAQNLLERIRVRMQSIQAREAAKVAGARAGLKGVRQARGQEAEQVRDQLLDAAGISGAIDPTTGVVANLGAYETTRANKLKFFWEQIRQLKADKINRRTLNEIIGQGADTGGTLAQSLLTDPSQIKTVNRQVALAARYAGRIGQIQAHGDYQRAMVRSENHLRDMLAEQQTQTGILDVIARHLQGKITAAELETALHSLARKRGQKSVGV